jgi:hypothetical protein
MFTGSQLDARRCAETLKDVAVRGGETPSAKARVSDKKPIEGIPGPRQIQGLNEPGCGWRLVDDPSIVIEDGLHRGPESDFAGFVKELELEQRRGRDVQPVAVSDQPANASVGLLDPDQRIRIKEDHDRRRPWNRRPAGVHSHRHCPSATARSTISMIGRRALRRGLAASTDNR